MNDADRRELVERYENRLTEHGVKPEALGWTRPALQLRRFAAIADLVTSRQSSSLLDVGCGFADLRDFLRARGWSGAYAGVDVVAAFIDAAKERDPTLDVRHADFSSGDSASPAFDFVVASGLFNGRLRHEPHEEYVSRTIRRMFEHCRIAVCVDFLSTWVNYQKDLNWHADPSEMVRFARSLTRRVYLRHDYLPFEFSLILYRQDAVSSDSTFVDV